MGESMSERSERLIQNSRRALILTDAKRGQA